MNRQSYINPYSQPYPTPQYTNSPSQKQNPPGQNEGKWSFKDWLVKVIIPILTAPILATLITIMVSAGSSSAKPTSTPISTTNTISSSSAAVATLRHSYTGTSSLNGVPVVGLTISNLTEDTQGNFQAVASATSSQGTCSGLITEGKVNSDNQVTFKFQQQSAFGCAPTTTDFSGHIDNTGEIVGTWGTENTSSQGDFILS